MVVTLDWLNDPPRSSLISRQLGYWLIYPFVFLVYTPIRGATNGWYLYPFLNSSKAGGYGAVEVYCTEIFVVFLVVGRLLIAVGNILRRNTTLPPA